MLDSGILKLKEQILNILKDELEETSLDQKSAMDGKAGLSEAEAITYGKATEALEIYKKIKKVLDEI